VIGEYLKKCRESSGLDLEAISRKTRIRPDHLRDLETEDFKRFAGSVYVKGYMKQYLEALAIDPSEGLSIYDKMLEKSDEVRQPDADASSSQTISPAKIIYSVILAVVLAAAIFYFFGVRTQDEKPADETLSRPAETAGQTPPAQQAITPPAAKKAETPPILTGQGVQPPASIAVQPPASIVVRSPASTSEKSADAGKEPAALPAPKTDEPRQTKKYTLSIKAVQETWISARLDGKEHHSELLQPGASIVLGADEKIIIRIGNAGGVIASFNNKDMGSLGESKQIVTLTLPKPESKPKTEPEPKPVPATEPKPRPESKPEPRPD
jgi:cytoskeleton protein RodZ